MKMSIFEKICNKDFSSLICSIGSVVSRKPCWQVLILIVKGNQMKMPPIFANNCNKDFSSLICYIGSVVAQKTMWVNYILIVRGTQTKMPTIFANICNKDFSSLQGLQQPRKPCGQRCLFILGSFINQISIPYKLLHSGDRPVEGSTSLGVWGH